MSRAAVATIEDAPAPVIAYRTIVIDPPWSYRNKWHQRRSATTNIGMTTRSKIRGSGAAANYPTLDLDQLRRLPVDRWAAPNAHLYLWTTNAFVREAHELAESWGFRPVTMLTWIKRSMGLGIYFRNTTEHVVFAVRGRQPVDVRNARTHFQAPRGRHSEKPDVFYQHVRRWSPGPWLDVFARRRRRGWHVYGNEVESDIPLVDLGKPRRKR